MNPDTALKREVPDERTYYNYENVTYKVSSVHDRELKNVSLNIRSTTKKQIKIHLCRRVTAKEFLLIDYIKANNEKDISGRGIWMSVVSDRFSTFVNLKNIDFIKNVNIKIQHRS